MTRTLSPLWHRLRAFLHRPGAPDRFPPLPTPDPPVCIIGDVHGCAGALDRLLDQINAQPDAQRARIIFVGDLMDRGPDSAAVLERVRLLCTQDPARVTCLKGNHEAMCLDALNAPAAMTRWLTHGGDTTLASFGLTPRAPNLGKVASTAWHGALCQALRRAWPPGTEDWLRTLPVLWNEQGLAVSHAGGAPNRPLDDQPDQALLWGHWAKRQRPRRDGIWMAHGHWVQSEVTSRAGWIALDTGAYCGGRLSAVWLDPDGMRVMSAAE